jgi:hypothetical protein
MVWAYCFERLIWWFGDVIFLGEWPDPSEHLDRSTKAFPCSRFCGAAIAAALSEFFNRIGRQVPLRGRRPPSAVQREAPVAPPGRTTAVALQTSARLRGCLFSRPALVTGVKGRNIVPRRSDVGSTKEVMATIDAPRARRAAQQNRQVSVNPQRLNASTLAKLRRSARIQQYLSTSDAARIGSR